MPDPESKPRTSRDDSSAPDADEPDPSPDVDEDESPDDGNVDVDDQGRESFPASDPPANY
jgi:hypothetical protein